MNHHTIDETGTGRRNWPKAMLALVAVFFGITQMGLPAYAGAHKTYLDILNESMLGVKNVRAEGIPSSRHNRSLRGTAPVAEVQGAPAPEAPAIAPPSLVESAPTDAPVPTGPPIAMPPVSGTGYTIPGSVPVGDVMGPGGYADPTRGSAPDTDAFDVYFDVDSSGTGTTGTDDGTPESSPDPEPTDAGDGIDDGIAPAPTPLPQSTEVVVITPEVFALLGEFRPHAGWQHDAGTHIFELLNIAYLYTVAYETIYGGDITSVGSPRWDGTLETWIFTFADAQYVGPMSVVVPTPGTAFEVRADLIVT